MIPFKYRPLLIDFYSEATREHMAQEQSIWCLAKPEAGSLSIIRRIIHSWLVLTGEATAVYFFEDLPGSK